MFKNDKKTYNIDSDLRVIKLIFLFKITNNTKQIDNIYKK